MEASRRAFSAYAGFSLRNRKTAACVEIEEQAGSWRRLSPTADVKISPGPSILGWLQSVCGTRGDKC